MPTPIEEEIIFKQVEQVTVTIGEVFAEVPCEIIFQAMANVLARMLFENLPAETTRKMWVDKFIDLVDIVIKAYEAQHKELEGHDTTPTLDT